jgi:hypothetical protein
MIAGRILAEVGDIARFATNDKFASSNGTAPIDVSSGDQVRHRLSRAGNRRSWHALHMMAVTQIRYPGTDGRRYYERQAHRGQDTQGSPALPQASAVGRWSIASSPLTGAAESKCADHLRRRGRCGLHLPHRRVAHPGPHHHPGRNSAHRGRVHRPGLERRPPRWPGDPRRKLPPAPRPPRGSQNHRLTAPFPEPRPFPPRPSQDQPDPCHAARSCQDAGAQPGVKAGPQARPQGCLDAGEHRHTLAKRGERAPALTRADKASLDREEPI